VVLAHQMALESPLVGAAPEAQLLAEIQQALRS
jgi:hypothetical protein